MSAEQLLLLTALSSRPTLGLGPDDVSWAFQQPKTADPVTAWVSRYLTSATLLTQEELEIYNHLSKTGTLKKLVKSSVSAPPVLAHSETQLASETEEMAMSTKQLQQQTAVLKAQKAALDNMRARQRAEKERRKKMDASRRRKWTGELEEIQAAVDDFVGMLNEEVVDLRSTVMGTEEDTVEVTRLLESDDRVLARLERLAAELVVPDEKGGEQEVIVKKVQDLVDKLSSLTQQAVRARLDRVFLESMHTSRPVTSPSVDDPPLQELQAEIDGLYAEIPAVAQNAADNEFLAPLMTSLKARRLQRGENYALGGSYIQQVLTHLTNRNAAMTSLLQSSQDRDCAVLSLLATIQRESTALQPSAPTSSEPSRPSTPPNRRSSNRLSMSPAKFNMPSNTSRPSSPSKLGRIPFLTPARRRRGGSIDHGLNKSEYPELALLSHLGVSLAPPSPPATTPIISNGAVTQHVAQQIARVDMLATTGWDRESWTDANAEAAQVRLILETALTGGFSVRGNDGGEGAMGALVEEGLRGKIGEVEMTVDSMARAAGALGGRVEAVERAGGDLNGVKGGFVSRWGR